MVTVEGVNPWLCGWSAKIGSSELSKRGYSLLGVELVSRQLGQHKSLNSTLLPLNVIIFEVTVNGKVTPTYSLGRSEIDDDVRRKML